MENAYERYVEQLHEAAAAGDVGRVATCLKGIPDVDAANGKGWTALMFAARNGHINVIKLLLEKGSDINLINSLGQTAADIAKFWNHHDVPEVLHSTEAGAESSPPGATGPAASVNYFCGNPLDRAAHRRKDSDWLQSALASDTTKFLLFHNLQAVVYPKREQSVGKKMERYRLLSVDVHAVKPIRKDDPLTVFLGIEPDGSDPEAADKKDGASPSTERGSAWFAVDCSHMEEEDVEKLHPHAEVLSLYPGLMQLTQREAGILAQARSVLAWHDRYQFCPTCGAKAVAAEAGWKRSCSKDDCRSHNGIHNTSYPRLDPTVIMAVLSSDGKQVLMGRSRRFPKGMWSCLAGFMETGESIEDACRREVFEESGVTVGHVEYVSCQPWPMPCSLMIGCLAWATSTDIKVDQEELEDARWFTRRDVIQMLNHKHPQRFFCPPEQAQAHQLLRAFVNRTSNL